jgi:hypothetical protein
LGSFGIVGTPLSQSCAIANDQNDVFWFDGFFRFTKGGCSTKKAADSDENKNDLFHMANLQLKFWL